MKLHFGVTGETVQLKFIVASIILISSTWVSAYATSQELLSGTRVVSHARLRYEHAQQDDRIKDAQSLTQRLGIIIETDLTPRISTLFEGEAVFALIDQFDDGRGNQPLRPIIADPDGLELSRAQVKVRLLEQTFFTAGRQRLSIDDERFIGPVAFRQNDQTFDGLYFSSVSKNGTTFQTGYFNAVNRVLGANNPAGKFKGDSYFFNANTETIIGRLGAFHYALDLGLSDGLALPGRSSSRTTGFRYDGRWHRGNYGIDIEASWARQTNFADNPAQYQADYSLGSARVFIGPVRGSARIESFGSGAEGAFQTPLATLHKFQGQADMFLVTPSGGLRDIQFKGDWLLGDVGQIQNISLTAAYHHFKSERHDTKLGSEVDLSIKTALGSFGFSATIADYQANSFAADTRRIFLTATTRF